MSLKYCTFCHNNQGGKTLCICTSLAYINIYQNKSKLSQWLLLPSPVSLPEDCCKGWANSLFPTLLHESPEWLETFIVTMVRGLYLPYITPRDILTVLWRVLFGGGEVEGGGGVLRGTLFSFFYHSRWCLELFLPIRWSFSKGWLSVISVISTDRRASATVEYKDFTIVQTKTIRVSWQYCVSISLHQVSSCVK